MNFSGLSSSSALGRLLRFPLSVIPSNTVLPIFQGSLRGYRWIVGSSNHGCWLGSFEYEKQKCINKSVRPGSVAYDLGANVGFYTLLLSELVGSGGLVVAFEPLPRNLEYLRRHIALNHVSNVVVMEGAVSSHSGSALFVEGPTNSMGFISSKGNVKVKLFSIDEMVSDGRIPAPQYLKIDIEGAEYDALCGAEATLQEFQPTIFLASHSMEIHQSCCHLLSELGYELKPILGNDVSKTFEILARHRDQP